MRAAARSRYRGFPSSPPSAPFGGTSPEGEYLAQVS